MIFTLQTMTTWKYRCPYPECNSHEDQIRGSIAMDIQLLFTDTVFYFIYATMAMAGVDLNIVDQRKYKASCTDKLKGMYCHGYSALIHTCCVLFHLSFKIT